MARVVIDSKLLIFTKYAVSDSKPSWVISTRFWRDSAD